MKIPKKAPMKMPGMPKMPHSMPKAPKPAYKGPWSSQGPKPKPKK